MSGIWPFPITIVVARPTPGAHSVQVEQLTGREAVGAVIHHPDGAGLAGARVPTTSVIVEPGA